jgi:hypothetical protein
MRHRASYKIRVMYSTESATSRSRI